MIKVAAAVIYNHSGELLIARKAPGRPREGLWEFPGGKLEEGEDVPDCLKRELLEEMGIAIEPVAFLAVNEHHYGDVHIELTAWTAEYAGGEVLLSDHDECRWVLPQELSAYPFAPADLPFLPLLSGGREA